MMQWPDWFSHADRYWLVCTLNEHGGGGELGSIDALVGALLDRLPPHLSTRPERLELSAAVEQTARLLYEQDDGGGLKRRQHYHGGAQQSPKVSRRRPTAGLHD